MPPAYSARMLFSRTTWVHFIQSEANIRSFDEVEHYVFPSISHGRPQGQTVRRASGLNRGTVPQRVLITGGASCPDGIIQQVICRLNGLWPAGELRPIEAVLADLQSQS